MLCIARGGLHGTQVRVRCHAARCVRSMRAATVGGRAAERRGPRLIYASLRSVCFRNVYTETVRPEPRTCPSDGRFVEWADGVTPAAVQLDQARGPPQLRRAVCDDDDGHTPGGAGGYGCGLSNDNLIRRIQHVSNHPTTWLPAAAQPSAAPLECAPRCPATRSRSVVHVGHIQAQAEPAEEEQHARALTSRIAPGQIRWLPSGLSGDEIRKYTLTTADNQRLKWQLPA
jgi:hypothetical protein